MNTLSGLVFANGGRYDVVLAPPLFVGITGKYRVVNSVRRADVVHHRLQVLHGSFCDDSVASTALSSQNLLCAYDFQAVVHHVGSAPRTLHGFGPRY